MYLARGEFKTQNNFTNNSTTKWCGGFDDL